MTYLGVVETERLLQMHSARTAPTSSSVELYDIGVGGDYDRQSETLSVERLLMREGGRRLYAVRTVLEPKNGVNFLGGPLGLEIAAGSAQHSQRWGALAIANAGEIRNASSSRAVAAFSYSDFA